MADDAMAAIYANLLLRGAYFSRLAFCHESGRSSPSAARC